MRYCEKQKSFKQQKIKKVDFEQENQDGKTKKNKMQKV